MMASLQGACVLVTGAACRIGRAIALRLAAQGARVIVHYNHSEAEARTLLACMEGEGHGLVQCDFTQMNEVSELIPRLVREGSMPTALVNNASVYSRVNLANATPLQADENMKVNFLAPFELMRQFKNCVRKGVIINLTDQRNAYPDPKSGIYAIAKKALQDAGEAAALEWAPYIRVNAVAPGLILPPPGRPADKIQALLEKSPLQMRTTEDQVAQAVQFILESPWMTGQTIFADSGLHLLGHNLESASLKNG